MTTATTTISWASDSNRRDEYIKLFDRLLAAQKHICLNECNIVSKEHCLACQDINRALEDAEIVIDSWWEE